MIKLYLCCILLILVILLIYKTYLRNIKPNIHNTNSNNNINDNNQDEDLLILIDEMKINTNKKINKAIEQGILEGFQAMNGNINYNDNTNTSSYINSKLNNSSNDKKLMLFYKSSCSYCNDFLPIWYQVINNLPNNVKYEEINSDKDNESNKQTNSYNITSVPTIILLINNEKKIYMGNRTYNEIKRFLNNYGINLISKTFEEFDDSGYSAEPEPTSLTNPNCPAVTFDSQFDVANDDYMYQIFNSNGQYGYATGGFKEGKMLSPFAASYSVVDSYLSSIPDTKNMEECATLYSKDIRGFGLCDIDKLNDILSYQTQIQNGSGKERISDTNYNTNNNVVNAIKKSCEL